MTFQIKDFNSICASLINYAKATNTTVTDYNIGSIARTIMEAPAAEMDELYQQMLNAVRDAIPVATYNSFSFSPLPSISASGLETVTIATQTVPVTIGAGTTFTRADNGQTYTSNVDVIIAEGATSANVLITCSVVGSIGNMPQGTGMTLSPVPAGFVSATNSSAFINGADVETDAQRLARFQQFILSLARSPVAGVLYGVKTTTIYDASGNPIERVMLASLVEPWVADNTQPIGLVNIYIHNGVGSTSAALLALAQQVVNGYVDASGNKVVGYKAAGVQGVVAIATEVPLAVTGVLTVATGYDAPTLETTAQQTIFTYLQGLDLGMPAIFAMMEKLVMNLVGVTNFVISAPTPGTDTTVDSAHKIMPGTITVTAA